MCLYVFKMLVLGEKMRGVQNNCTVECTIEYSKGINAKKHYKQTGGYKINEEMAQVPCNFLPPTLMICVIF